MLLFATSSTPASSSNAARFRGAGEDDRVASTRALSCSALRDRSRSEHDQRSRPLSAGSLSVERLCAVVDHGGRASTREKNQVSEAIRALPLTGISGPRHQEALVDRKIG